MKHIDFFFHTVHLFIRQGSADFTSYVHIISICLAWIMQSLQFSQFSLI